MSQHYRYKCPLPTCKEKADLAIAPTWAPWCNPPTGTHSKEMIFLPEESTGVPEYISNKKPVKKKKP